MEIKNVNIVSVIFGAVSFFISFNIVRAIYPLITVLLNLFDVSNHSRATIIKLALTIGIFLFISIVLFLIPFNMMNNKAGGDKKWHI